MNAGKILQDLLPTKVRLIIYLALFVASLVFGIWQASEGDAGTFVGSLIAALVNLLAAGNTGTSDGKHEIEG